MNAATPAKPKDRLSALEISTAPRLPLTVSGDRENHSASCWVVRPSSPTAEAFAPCLISPRQMLASLVPFPDEFPRTLFSAPPLEPSDAEKHEHRRVDHTREQ